MAFTVQLYEFSKKANSTLRPTGQGYKMDCEAHDPIDVMHPIMIFNTLTPFPYNYMYVPAWERYYWIDNWTHDKGLWNASCSIDPLASWRNQIGNMTEYVLRSAYDYDPDIMDTTYPLQADAVVDSHYLEGWGVSADEAGCHVVGVVSGNGLVEYYLITNLAEFGAYMFGDDATHPLWDNIVADDPGVIEGNIPTFMKAQFNPLQYVVSCVWFPINIPHAATKTPIKFGYFNSGYTAYKVNRASFQIIDGQIPIPHHPQKDRGLYLNYAPYTRLRLSALPWGEVDLDTTKFCNIYPSTFFTSTLYLSAWVDPVTGSTKLYVKNDSGVTILTLVGQIGVTEQLSQVLKDNLATVTGGLSAVAGVAQMATGNILGGIATAVSGIGNAVTAQYPDVSTTGTNGARIAVCPAAIWLTVTHQYIVEEDRVNHGRPLCERRRLSTLPGYLLISDPDVELPATKAEIEAIREFMTSGFFYE